MRKIAVCMTLCTFLGFTLAKSAAAQPFGPNWSFSPFDSAETLPGGVPAHDDFYASAKCPPGSTARAGGYQLTANRSDFTVVQSSPLLSASGWEVRMRNLAATPKNAAGYVFVSCFASAPKTVLDRVVGSGIAQGLGITAQSVNWIATVTPAQARSGDVSLQATGHIDFDAASSTARMTNGGLYGMRFPAASGMRYFASCTINPPASSSNFNFEFKSENSTLSSGTLTLATTGTESTLEAWSQEIRTDEIAEVSFSLPSEDVTFTSCVLAEVAL